MSSVWFEGNPCNMHLLDLAKEVRTPPCAENVAVNYGVVPTHILRDVQAVGHL